jgi:protein TonB
MSYADATLTQEQIQPRRIAATAVAVSIHVAILMMLMMPASVPSKVEVEEEPRFDWIVPKEIPITPPPPKPEVKARVEPTPQPVHQSAAPPEQLVESADQNDPGALDVPLTQIGPETIAPVETGSGIVDLGVQFGPAPTYPRAAIQRRFAGTVLLRIHVDASGHPIEVAIEQSSGFHILDEAALRQVQARWLFVPAQKDGRATDAWGLLPVKFALE